MESKLVEREVLPHWENSLIMAVIPFLRSSLPLMCAVPYN